MEKYEEEQIETYKLENLILNENVYENFKELISKFSPLHFFNPASLDERVMFEVSIPSIFFSTRSLQIQKIYEKKVLNNLNVIFDEFKKIYDIQRDYKIVFDSNLPIGYGKSSVEGYICLGTFPKEDLNNKQIMIRNGGLASIDILKAFFHELWHVNQFENLRYLTTEYGNKISNSLKNYNSYYDNEEKYFKNFAEEDAYFFANQVCSEFSTKIMSDAVNEARKEKEFLLENKQLNEDEIKPHNEKIVSFQTLAGKCRDVKNQLLEEAYENNNREI